MIHICNPPPPPNFLRSLYTLHTSLVMVNQPDFSGHTSVWMHSKTSSEKLLRSAALLWSVLDICLPLSPTLWDFSSPASLAAGVSLVYFACREEEELSSRQSF